MEARESNKEEVSDQNHLGRVTFHATTLRPQTTSPHLCSFVGEVKSNICFLHNYYHLSRNGCLGQVFNFLVCVFISEITELTNWCSSLNPGCDKTVTVLLFSNTYFQFVQSWWVVSVAASTERLLLNVGRWIEGPTAGRWQKAGGSGLATVRLTPADYARITPCNALPAGCSRSLFPELGCKDETPLVESPQKAKSSEHDHQTPDKPVQFQSNVSPDIHPKE